VECAKELCEDAVGLVTASLSMPEVGVEFSEVGCGYEPKKGALLIFRVVS